MIGNRNNESDNDNNIKNVRHVDNSDNDNTNDTKNLLPIKQQQYTDDQPILYESNTTTINTVLQLINSYLQYYCYYYPFYCSLVMIGIVAVLLWLTLGYILNTKLQFGTIESDHTNIQSIFDIHIDNINYWCLGGDDYSCKCDDPTIPLANLQYPTWKQSVVANRYMIQQQFIAKNTNPDVAFLGESIIEEMNGRWLGEYNRSIGLHKLYKLFQKNFNSTTNSPYTAVALGVAGDTAPNVLWRLLHGEMPDHFNPKIWWINIGMNDLTRKKCSEEVVLIGILRIVEEILEKRPTAHVVINSLLPMTKLRGDRYPHAQDIEDSFISSDDRKKPNKSDKEHDSRRRRQLRIRRKKQLLLLRDTKRQKEYKIGHIRKNKIPLWGSVKVINEQLELFANKHSQRVSYYDATRIFITKRASSRGRKPKLFLRTDLSSPKGYPTIEGFRILQGNIIQFLTSLDAKLMTYQLEQDKISQQQHHDATTKTNNDDKFLINYTSIHENKSDKKLNRLIPSEQEVAIRNSIKDSDDRR